MKKVNYYVRKNGMDFVGIDALHDELNVYLPIGYSNIEEKDIDIKKFIRLLAKETKIKEEYSKSNFNFITCLKIVDDYYNHGLYKQSQKKKIINGKGNTNWQRTIHLKQTYLNDKIIYTNLVNEYIDYKTEKEVQTIQEYCLSIISECLGNVLCFSYPKRVRTYSDKEMMNILNQEIKTTNEDIKILVLNNLINFIKDENIKALEKGKISIKYKRFEYIFQNLVDYYGLRIEEKKDYYPKAIYKDWTTGEKKKCYESYPDTIIDLPQEYNEIFLLDAKYHGVNNENGLLKNYPNEYEIFKQHRYKNYLQKQLKNERKNCVIKNAFVIPKQLQNSKAKMEDFYAISSDLEEEGIDERIYIIYVDTKSLIIDTKGTMKKVMDILSNHNIIEE